jgi:hypothetical protein
MRVSFWVLLCATLTLVSSSVVVDDAGVGPCQESPWLCLQLNKMQTAMAEQQRIADMQNAVIKDLNHKVDVQNLEIDQLKAENLKQYRTNDRLIQELSKLKAVNHEQNLEIDQLKHMNLEQNEKIDQQNKELSQMNVKITKQDQVIQQIHAQLHTAYKEKHEKDGSRRIAPLSKSNTSIVHKMMLRADDGGPLEAVVNQMSQQIANINADIQALKNTDQQILSANHQQDANIQDARTSTYVHWGSSHCPADAQLVYSGVVGGSVYTEAGGGSNYLCLTMSPIIGSHSDATYYAYLYGAEYQTNTDAHHDMDALCAMCRSSHATTIMIPGTNVCTSGWTKQYDGYLMAGYRDHLRSEFVCVDSVMESRPGTGANLNGALFYYTVTQCGSLPCEPYQNNKIVTCVVCSK